MGGGEAELRYLDGDFEILKPGTHVLCAVTGQEIALDDLRYWRRCGCPMRSGAWS